MTKVHTSIVEIYAIMQKIFSHQTQSKNKKTSLKTRKKKSFIINLCQKDLFSSLLRNKKVIILLFSFLKVINIGKKNSKKKIIIKVEK